MPPRFSTQLLKWYEQYGRHDLPWQINPTPYRVWISEIMLQQTQVTTVIPYFQRFMQRFPTIQSLATAPEDDVLAHWSGLGYYARARNIHKTAQIIHTDYRSRFPKTVDALMMMPGIGRSTAGAIIGFSQKIKAVILDGNVKRVLSRYFALKEPVNKTQVIQQLWSVADQLTPEKNAHQYNQAIMDLGATLCTRTKPRCTECPVKTQCLAFQENQPTLYPIKTVKKARPTKTVRLLIIQNAQQEILLLKRPSRGIWGGLWSFPEQAVTAMYHCFYCDDKMLSLRYIDELEKITHTFTHFTLEIFPLLAKATQKTVKQLIPDPQKFIWHNLSQPLPGGIAAPVARILEKLKGVL